MTAQILPFPPRGFARMGLAETAPRGIWMPPEQLGDDWTYDEKRTPRAVLLGTVSHRLIGRSDDRHMVTIAGGRAGKTFTIIVPNLSRYRGSAVVIDPKGEIANATAKIRAAMGHKVFILDPFNVRGRGTHGHNPCAELLRSPLERLCADAAQLADALIIDQPKDPHWTDSAKNLIMGLILYLLIHDRENLSIRTLRRLLSDAKELYRVLRAMMLSDALDGVIRNVGASFFAKFRVKESGPEANDEMLSVLATCNAQTRPLDDLNAVFSRHDFDLDIFSRSEQPTTVYLILPATLIPTHSRWLRLFVTQLIATMERHPIHRTRLPLWLILEEFAALGYMRSIEAAAGYCAGFGVKLWTILQDLTQIKTHYPNSWETFLRNAGIIDAFGNVDVTTTKYLSDLLGQTTIIEEQKGFVTADQRAHGDDGIRQNLRSVPLLSPSEITLHFARERSSHLVLVPGHRPVFLPRLPIEQTED
jgi:type IV secretion system protein VirD4